MDAAVSSGCAIGPFRGDVNRRQSTVYRPPRRNAGGVGRQSLSLYSAPS